MPHGYLNDALIILLAATIVVPVFQRLRSSPVLGYLVAGTVIGPFGLGIIGDVENTMVLAHFGVVFLLFTIGLELSAERLWVMRRLVFGLGAAQVLVTGAAIGLGAAAVLGLTPEPVLVLAGGLALSSTAIVLQILVERGELTSRHGRISFAILLFQDLAVVLLLTLVSLLASPETSMTAAVALALVKAAAALLVIVVLGRVFLRPLLRMVAETHSSELFTGVTLLVVLGVSWITERAGLSMALGAFLAGLVIAETEYRHQVEADIQPFRGILLSLFFMSVGMTIDLRLIIEQAPLVAVLVIALMAGKAAILTGLIRLFGYPSGLSVQVGLSLSQGGEFAFVLFSLASQSAVLSAPVSQTALLVVAISMALTPIVMAVGRWAGQRLTPLPAVSIDLIEEGTSGVANHVLIAGFGRVGQTLSRLLEAMDVPYVALDLEPRRVVEGRERSVPVYFGDSRRSEVLKAAGGDRACAAVVTLDHTKAAEATVRAIRLHWPDLPILVRARDDRHRANLEQAGATMVVPELVEGSLHLGSLLLRRIGKPAESVAKVLKSFRDESYTQLDDLIHPVATRPPPRHYVAPDDLTRSLEEADDPRR